MAQIRSKQIRDFLSTVDWNDVSSTQIANTADIKLYVDGVQAALGNEVNASIDSLESALSLEISATNVDVSSLDVRVEAEEDRLTAVLDAVGANPDSFADVVSIINAVDLENDDALAVVISNLNAEISATNIDLASVDARVLADEQALAAELSSTNAEQISQNTRMTGIEGDLTALETKHDSEMLAHHNEHLSLIAAEEARATGIEGSLETRLSTEEVTRATADSALSGRIDTLEATIQEDNEQFVDKFIGAGFTYTLTQPVQDDNIALINAYVNGHRVELATVAGVQVDIANPGFVIDADDTVIFVYQF